MSLREKQLGQARPADTNAASIYSPDAGVVAIIKTIIICNTTAASHDFRIFLDDDGTTYDENTALYFDEALAANTTKIINLYAPMNNSSGNLAVRSDTASAFTFTVLGAEIVQ